MTDQQNTGSSSPTISSPDGRYAKCNEVLGKGAYKVVHKAIDREEGYEVAWNTCQVAGGKVEDPVIIQADILALTEEIEILKRVRHPNIIQFYDYWFSNSEFVFITELMTSGTIKEYMKRLKVLNDKIVKRWARQIMKGIDFLHSHSPPIIHRDIKCDNIFINGCYGEVKIGDMGTSKMKIGKKYTVIGTPEFMAPEMYEEKGYNESVDIYAFGMTLLEMATNEYPYSECKNAAQVYKKVSQGIRPDCLKKVTNNDVLDLIIRCTDVESKRITATQVLEHRFLATEPEVLLYSMEGNSHLGMKVIFNGPDKFSVNFQFDPNTDTAEQVVNEMIHEQVLPAEYMDLITGEINKILRNMSREKNLDWYPNKIDNSRGVNLTGNNTELYEGKFLDKSETECKPAVDTESYNVNINSISETPTGQVKNKPEVDIFRDQASMGQDLYYSGRDTLNSDKRVYFKNDVPVEVLVRWAARLANRLQKVDEWLSVLSCQDIATVGDLRQLHEEDWASLSLTVFARRSIKNALTCKGTPSNPVQTTQQGIDMPLNL